MTRPLVTVVIPAYHAARFIRRALESVRNQSFQDLEVILVVDDYMHDKTPEIAAEFIPYLTIIPIFSKDKTSPAAARNRAIAQARGQYLAFLDADDEWHKNHLADAAGYLSLNPDTAVYYAMCVNITDMPESFHGVRVENIEEFCPAPFSTIVTRNPPAFLFDERLRAADDYLWLLKTYRSGAGIHFEPHLESNYYLHGDNLTSGAPDWPVQHFMVRLLAGDYRTAMHLLPAAIRAKCSGRFTKRNPP